MGFNLHHSTLATDVNQTLVFARASLIVSRAAASSF